MNSCKFKVLFVLFAFSAFSPNDANPTTEANVEISDTTINNEESNPTTQKIPESTPLINENLEPRDSNFTCDIGPIQEPENGTTTGDGHSMPTACTEENAKIFMNQINAQGARRRNRISKLSWAFSTNITDHNRNIYTKARNENGKYVKKRWNRMQEWKDIWPTFKDETLKRQFHLYSVIFDSALPHQEYEKLVNITTEMRQIYSTAKISDFKNASIDNLSLEPDLKEILKSSRDYEELLYVWKSWRDAAGKPSRNLFSEYVELKNEAASVNGFETAADMQLYGYESDTFEDELELLYQQLRPLYQQLHAYTRRKLREVYGEERIPRRGPIPAHVTGNMWAQSWVNIYDLLVPFPNKTSLDITPAMKQLNYTPKFMFEKADDFFSSLGFEKLYPEFWERSMLVKPDDREVVCHASAWDFGDGRDFRIKQCTTVNMEDFSVVHHELGHIQYYMQYKDLPAVLKTGANPGFHEAVGDLMDLSSSTPKHLQKIGLLKDYVPDDEADINYLLSTALGKIAFLPFGYGIDKYRWDIYRGKIVPSNYTKAWWDMRYNLQGISPPVERTEEDFDPAAKYHVSGDVGYIRYFVSTILQFQFYESACLLAKEFDPNDATKPLHRCDFYGSQEAGKAIRDMLKLGASVHWKKALKILTGKENMDASSLRNYFLPLEKWLTADNEKHGEFVGWEDGTQSEASTNENVESTEAPSESQDSQVTEIEPRNENEATTISSVDDPQTADATPINETSPVSEGSSADMTEAEAQIFMKDINKNNTRIFHELVKDSWNYQTNITKQNKEKLLKMKNLYGEFAKNRWNEIQKWKTLWPQFKNESLKRQFKLSSVLGTPALPQDKYQRLNVITSTLGEAYSIGKICDYRNETICNLSLEPEMENILKSSRNYDELIHVWKSWRDTIGRPARKLYSEMVQLLNQAATLNDFPSTAEMWTHEYDSTTFENDLERIFTQLRPLYEQLHAYVRRKLREAYGESKISKSGPIPAHVTGNMWAQSWLNIYDLLIPFPNKTSVDVTDTMVEQGYTPRKMFEAANEFFVSLGMKPVPETFWNYSMLEKPDDREVHCHASAWDFSDGKDFRIKQCTEVNMEYFTTVHHELGHVQYYMQYKDLPFNFRKGANPGFHEAVGDVIDLSVSTPKHLHKIGLLKEYSPDDELDINFLLRNALKKVAYLPFAYLVDKYRWDIFRGHITPANYTKAWWDYRYKFQGLKPPVPRTEEDFDPAAKSHVSLNSRYMKYFVANILQFQFHKAACLLANEYDPNDPTKPMHRCDIYQSKEAGNALANMLKLGASKHWSKALKEVTGVEHLDASALRDYFRPLENWLQEDNKKHGEFVGWKSER